jgi:hypothetical protein
MRGGYRPGSGPAKGTKYKPRAPKPGKEDKATPPDVAPVLSEGDAKQAKTENLEAAEFLRRVWNDTKIDMALRLRAAEIVYKQSSGPKGKKEEKNDKAKQAGHGRFAAGAPPAKILSFKKGTE